VKRAAAVLTLAGLFVAGLLVGAAATHLFYAHKLQRPGGPSRAVVEMFHHRLEQELALTPRQADEIRSILERNHARAEELRNEVFPRVREIMDEASREIESVLDESQRRKFRELRERHRWRSDPGLLGHPGQFHGRGHRSPRRPPP
jgi:hypothetical protein